MHKIMQRWKLDKRKSIIPTKKTEVIFFIFTYKYTCFNTSRNVNDPFWVKKTCYHDF